LIFIEKIIAGMPRARQHIVDTILQGSHERMFADNASDLGGTCGGKVWPRISE